MKVGIVCSDRGWIYERFVVKLGLYSRNQVFLNPTKPVDLFYCLPYYEPPPAGKPFVVWASHQEAKEPLKSKFVSAAKQANYALSHSSKYAQVLRDAGVSNVKQVLPGVDLDQYRIKPHTRGSKIVVGWVGRSYTSSNRKNPGVLDALAKSSDIDLMITGGKIPEAQMPEFYAQCDLIVSPSLYEGGPMSHLEALACGKPFLCYEGVGTADEFQHGTLTVPRNEKAFIARIRKFWAEECDHYERAEVREQLRAQVRPWQDFVRDHDDVWESI